MPKIKGYGQFCPVAQAAEIVAERWTPLVLRELLCGSHRFSDLRRGVPLMSPTLLAERLKQLEDAGVVEQRERQEGRGTEYHLTESGERLRPVIEGLGTWGHVYLRRRLPRTALDPSLLMWDIRRRVDLTKLPREPRRVARFDLSGVAAGKSRWWLVFERNEIDLCVKDPGYELDLLVSAPIRTLVNVWLGHLAIEAAVGAGELRLEGERAMVRSFPKWFLLSPFAAVRRGAA